MDQEEPMGTYSVQADTARNVLRVQFVDYFSDDEARDACREVVEQAATLRRGFTIITDISRFKAASEAGAQEIQRIQGELAGLGVGRVIRVVGGKVIPSMQLTRTAREAGYEAGANAITVDTLEQAEALLD
jgi:hypothetical protein